MVAHAVAAAACCLLATTPFLAVELVPSTDLPQHFGQLRLLERAWDDPADELAIQWWTPYWLVYALLAVPWALLPPLTAAKVGAWLLMMLQIGAVHALAWKLQRPAAAAVLASCFAFSQLFYWGFVNFLFGWAVFVLWFLASRRRPATDEPRWREPLLFGALALALYLSHALWFGLGLAWLAVEAWLSGRGWRRLAMRAAGVLPVVIAAAVWFVAVRGSSFATAAEWGLQSYGRGDPRWILLGALGGIRHPVEMLVLGTAALWVLLALVAGRRQRWLGCDPYLAALALMLLALYLVLPNKYVNTIRLSSRWLPFLFATALLAVGPLPIGRIVRGAVAGVLIVLLVATTAVAWRAVEAQELGGLDAALTALPPEPRRVLGLNYLGASRYLWVAPFRQAFAWAQVARGGELSFSFGYFATSLVVYRDLDRVVWTRNLDNFPQQLRDEDLEHFDFVLVAGDGALHGRFAAASGATAMTTGEPWRLYRVDRR